MEREIILMDGRRVMAPSKPTTRPAISHSIVPMRTLDLNGWMTYIILDHKKDGECPTRKYVYL